jgi:hypothetical protein
MVSPHYPVLTLNADFSDSRSIIPGIRDDNKKSQLEAGFFY